MIKRYLIYGQACFYTGLLLCIAIRPHGLAANAGISYYGVYRETIVPYIIALLGPAYFFIRIGDLVTDPDHWLRYVFTVMGLLLIGLLITPASVLDSWHRVWGSVLFVLQLLLSGWVTVQSGYKLWAAGLTALEVAGGIASAVYLAPAQGFLLQAQVVFQAAFGLLMIYAFDRLPILARASGRPNK